MLHLSCVDKNVGRRVMKGEKEKPKEKGTYTIPVQFRFDQKTLDKLNEISEKEGRTRSGMVRWLIMNYKG